MTTLLDGALSSKNSFARVKTSAMGLLTAVAMTAISAAPAQAFTQELVDAKLHLIQCGILLFTDPETHLVECGVGDGGPGGSLSFYITGIIEIPMEVQCATNEYVKECYIFDN